MAEKRLMLLVNPNAGRGGYKSVLGGILQILCDGGWLPTVYFTKAPGDAPRLVEEHAGEYELVTCLGGDGTLSEVAAGLLRSGAAGRVPIGYIPLGTTNDVARTLGLSSRPLEAAKQILDGSPRPYDIGQFGADDFFTYIAAFGAFTEVSYARSRSRPSATWPTCWRPWAGWAASPRPTPSWSMTAACWRAISSSAA